MNKQKSSISIFSGRLIVTAVFLVFIAGAAKAASAEELDYKSKAVLTRLVERNPAVNEVLNKSKGSLVFPGVYKAGIFFLGGEYGEGILYTKDSTNSYYNLASASFGWQLGVQKNSIIMLFMNDQVLDDFRSSQNWEIGADASVAVVTVGASGSIDASTLNKPILVFVTDQKGLMYNLTLEGTKITKINKD